MIFLFRLLFTICVIFLVPSLPAQTTSPGHSPDAAAAYSEIARTSDPQKRLEMLEKFVDDFPESPRVSQARNQVLDTLIKSFPDQKGRILAQAEKMIEAAPEKRNPGERSVGPTRASVSSVIAGKLADSGILLDEAEAIAKRGLALLDEKTYIAEQKENFARMKKVREEALAKRKDAAAAKGEPAPAPGQEATEPTDEELSRNFRRQSASQSVVLGQIYLKQGRYEDSARIFKQAYDANPTLLAALTGLGELAVRDSKYDLALDYLGSAALTGRLPVAGRKQMEGAWAKLHNGSLDGLEEMLDARYRKEFPSPVKVERYQPTAARSAEKSGPAANRVVLGEVFTGSGCPPCVAADLAFESAMGRYSSRELAVLMYHLHIPQPDPIANPSTQARAKFYAVNAVPGMFIDGIADGRGGGSRENTKAVYDRINPKIEKALEVPPAARIRLQAELKGATVVTAAKLERIASGSKNLRLQIALVERELRYTGENGIRFHPMVVRCLAGPNALGFPVDAAGPSSFEHKFDLAKITEELKAHLDDYEINGKHGKITFRRKMHEINPDDLAIVAFLQDETTKAVLQAVVLELSVQ